MNLDVLRRKRIQRLRIKAPAHSGQQRIYFVLERATRKFPGDIGLWMQYIEYSRKQKAYKKLAQILTSVVRLHPSNPQLWIYAAQFFVDEHADMTEARSYMLRGIRFCKGSRDIWLEYTKLELVYIAKVAARHKVLGLADQATARPEDLFAKGSDRDLLPLPTLTAEDLDPKYPSEALLGAERLQELNSSPALADAIPMAIFDAAMKNFDQDAKLGQQMFDIVSRFRSIGQQQAYLRHIVESLSATNPDDVATAICEMKFSLGDCSHESPDFPSRLGFVLKKMRIAIEDPRFKNCRWDLAMQCTYWLIELRSASDLDTALVAVINSSLQHTSQVLTNLNSPPVIQRARELSALRSTLEASGASSRPQAILSPQV